MKINKNIIELRQKYDLSKQDFCDIIGINRRTLERWESGKRMPDLYSLRAIIDKFYITDLYTFVFGKRYETRKSLTDIKNLQNLRTNKAPCQVK